MLHDDRSYLNKLSISESNTISAIFFAFKFYPPENSYPYDAGIKNSLSVNSSSDFNLLKTCLIQVGS